MPDIQSHKRVNDILLGPLERPALLWLSAHTPAWLTPDRLTVIGLLGAFIIAAGYILTRLNPAFLWLASLGFVINWYGDSLDGNVARYRQIQRPRYGFFVDHTIDAFEQMIIFLALGISIYVRFDLACLALISYLLVSIFSYVQIAVSGVHQLSYGKLGPTEIRVLAILINTTLFFTGNPVVFQTRFGPFTAFDVALTVIILVLQVIFIVSSLKTARELSIEDPTPVRNR